MSTHHFVIEVLCKALLQRRKKTSLGSGALCIARGGTRRGAGFSAGRRVGQSARVPAAEQQQAHCKTLRIARNAQRSVHTSPNAVLALIGRDSSGQPRRGRQVVVTVSRIPRESISSRTVSWRIFAPGAKALQSLSFPRS